MRLRYAGRCRSCDAPIPAGTVAIYDRPSKTVTCVTCSSPRATPEPVSAGSEAHAAPLPTAIEIEPGMASVTENSEVFSGTAGESARREFDRRRAKRVDSVRTAHPHIGGFLLAIHDDPQSTKAWAVGARGEELLGRRLDGLADRGVRVLHDRRIPSTKANIDHIAVGPSGVFVIDAKRYVGKRPTLRVEGGLFRQRTESLMVGSRDCTKLVEGVHHQLALVQGVLQRAQLTDVPVRGMLCFIEAEWPTFGGAFAIDGLDVLWPKKASEHIARPGPFDAAAVDQLHKMLAAAFPPA